MNHWTKKLAILDALPGTPVEVAERTGYGVNMVRQMLYAFQREGTVAKHQRVLGKRNARSYVWVIVGREPKQIIPKTIWRVV